MGKVIVAFQDEQRRKELIRKIDFKPMTANTISSPEQYERELERVRELGYAVDDEEEELGIRCVGAPVFQQDGTLAGAISLSGTTSQLRVSNLTFLIDGVKQTAERISLELGFADEALEGPVPVQNT